MQRMPAQKRKDHFHDVAEAAKLLVSADFPRVSRDYRLGLPDGELALFPDPATVPTQQHANTDFNVMFFPNLGAPVNLDEWDDKRWMEYLRERIEELRRRG
jgi:hypothetical protein